jgi:deazaflavin-dependent oxidoreductase (nitroreductase family)
VGAIRASRPDDPIPLAELLTRFVLTRPGRWFAINVAARVDPFLMRLTGGRVSCFGRAPVVLLTVRGRRTGKPRTCPLLYYTEGDDAILVASNFGRESHPAWYHNVLAAPEVTLTSRGGSGRYRGREVTDEAERRRLYADFERMTRAYGNYRERTESSGRTIRVLRLTPKT